MNGIKFPVFFLGKNFQHLESCLLIKIKNKKIKLLYFQEDITNKTEILLKVAFNTITPYPYLIED
jgi:hypothetical protein